MIEGLTRMYLGRWDEGTEVASILDMDLSAKAFEPGARVSVRVAPLYQSAAVLAGSYSGQLHLIDPEGAEIYQAEPMLFDALEEQLGGAAVR